MSQQAITEFWQRLNSDETLRGEFDALVTSHPNVPATQVVDLGARHGLDFTAEELHTSVRLAAGAELSEDELSAVAGGFARAIKIDYFLKFEAGDALSVKVTSTSGFGIINF